MRPHLHHQALPGSSRSARRFAGFAGTVCSLLLASTVMSLSAGASGGTLGQFKATGSVSGNMTLDKMTSGPEGLSIEGCQVGQESTQILLNFPATKLSVSGHSESMKDIEVTIDVLKNGNTEKATATSQAEVGFFYNIGKKTSIWKSDSGTITTKPKGDGGSFNVGLIPSTNAKGTMKLSGSFSSCHPF